MQQLELPWSSRRTLPHRQTRPGQQEQWVLEHLQDPWTQQPEGHQQKYRGVYPGSAATDNQQNEGREGTKRTERWVEGARHPKRERGTEDGRVTCRTLGCTEESGRNKGQQNVRHDGAKPSPCDSRSQCGQ